MRVRRTLKCKVRACLTLTERGRGKLSYSHKVVDYNCINSSITADKSEIQVLYSSSVSHDSLLKKKNTKIIDSSYCFPRLTWQTHSLPPHENRQGHITHSLVLQPSFFFISILKTNCSEKLLGSPDNITCPNILPSV